MAHLKSLTLTTLPPAEVNPVLDRRNRTIARLEEQKQLLAHPGYTRTVKTWVDKDGERQLVEKHQRVLPWWRTAANGSVAFFIRVGQKPLEFEKGKAAISVPSSDKFPHDYVVTRLADAVAKQLATCRPRNANSRVATISEAAKALTKTLLDAQSTSTRALLKAIANGQHTFGGKISHFPGRLDDGLRAMGAWDHDRYAERPKTLYTGKPDVVLAIFNSPFGPDVLVTTDRLSEGVDLHRCCRHLIHYELDPSPLRTLQRNGRVRRVGSWAAITDQPIRYAFPTFGGTRDEKAAGVMKQRINAFGLLLGGVPSLDDDAGDSDRSFVEEVLRSARKGLESLNRKLIV